MSTAIEWEKLARMNTHQLQVMILEVMAESEEPMSPKLLSDHFDLPIGNVSYHVKCLHGARLIEMVDTAQRRGATEHFYTVAS